MNTANNFRHFLFLAAILIVHSIQWVRSEGAAKGEFSAPVSGPRAATLNVAFCPFCAAINATFGEQINKHEISVIAKLVEAPPETEEDAEEFPKAKFEILQVFKGEQFVAKGMTFQTMLVGKYPVGEKFLVMGVEPPSVFWSMPMQASDRLIQYLADSRKLPEKGPDRLAFFQDYFEDVESVIAYDAYDEFAIADYEDMIAMKPRIKREPLIKWINDPEIRIERRRLYFTMLALCGNQDDIKMLEGFLVADDPEKREGLDALAAAYLTLKGVDGIPLLEERFLTDFDEAEDTSETNAVISALRFHGTEVNQLPRERIAQAVRLALKHPQLADTVIPDLARWEDWSVLEELVDLFKNCKDEYKYVRVPVVAYLHSCPKPEAKAYLKELEAIDPDSIRRARFFMGEPMDDEIESEADDDQTDGEDAVEGPAENPAKDGAPTASEPSSDDSQATEKDSATVPSGDGGQSVEVQTVEVSADVMLTVPVAHKAEGWSDDGPVPAAQSGGRLAHSQGAQSQGAQSRGAHSQGAHSQGGAEEEIGPEPASRETSKTAAMPVSESKTTTSFPVLNPPADSALTKADKAERDRNPVENVPVAVVSSTNIVWLILFVPMGFSLVFFVLIWSVVNGWFERLIV